MTPKPPIYTEETQCQDCYKCVRSCPVKAIKVLDGSAAVVREECIFCGTCVNVCPMGAKKVRNDITGATKPVAGHRPVFLSLAPSWAAEFPNWDEGHITAAIKKLGFTGVSETALGAEIVSGRVAELIREYPSGILLSTACPSAVELARKYYPALTERMTPISSPVLAHCRFLRRVYGPDITVVFAGPCISKKLEADRHPELLAAALTFEDLRAWLDSKGIVPEKITPSPEDRFIPRSAGDGTLYPVDGGMTESVRLHLSEIFGPSGNNGTDATGKGAVPGMELLSFSGTAAVMEAMQDLESGGLEGGVFLELLACKGGCINGPKTGRKGAVSKRMVVGALARSRMEKAIEEAPEAAAGGGAWLPESACGDEPMHTGDADTEPDEYAPQPPTHGIDGERWSENDIREALAGAGKYSEADELNCGGCGYDSCRAFSRAILEGKAEVTMCVSYMRKLALKKANALIKAMPSGVVIAGRDMEVIECNRRFAELMGEETVLAYEANPGLEGARLHKVVPFANFFEFMMDGEYEIFERQYRMEERILAITLFPVEPGRVVGAIVQDITRPEVQREEIIRRVEEVTEKNMKTVQQIAYLLGENAAENEIILKSITDAYAVRPVTEET